MIEKDIMFTRFCFLCKMAKSQVHEWHTHEKRLDRYLTGHELSRALLDGKKTEYLTDLSPCTDRDRLENDIWKLRPHKEEDWTPLDWYHAWDWQLFHNIHLMDYNLQYEKKRHYGSII